MFGRLATSSPSASSTPARWRSCRARAARFGIDVTLVDGTVPGAFAAAVQPGRTMLVLAETPVEPAPRARSTSTRSARSRGPFTVVDSTFATPLGQQPLAHGVDLVLHSATKGIAGHNDATLGVVAGERDLLDAIWSYAVLHGATASPFDALNALRGIRTLAVRTAHQAATARCARRRRSRGIPASSAVHYPGLTSHPQHDLAKRQMRHVRHGAGVRPRRRRRGVRRCSTRCGSRASATSLGGPETLVCHPMTTTHVSLTPDEQADRGVTPGLVRLSVGLEDPDDLVADIQRALGLTDGKGQALTVVRRSGARRGRTRTSSPATRRSAVATSRSPRPGRGFAGRAVNGRTRTA